MSQPTLLELRCKRGVRYAIHHRLDCACADCAAVRQPPIAATLGLGTDPLDRLWRALRAGEPWPRALVTAGFRDPSPPMPAAVKDLLRERAKVAREVRRSLRARRSS